MFNLIHADLYRIRKMTSVKVAVLITLVSSLFIAYVLHGMTTGNFDAEFCTKTSVFVDVMLVALLGGMLTGELVSTDFESKNIHDEIASGCGRMAMIVARTISYVLVILMITLPYALVCVIGLATGIDFEQLFGIPSAFFAVLSNQGNLAINAETIAKAVVVCLAIMVTYAARLSICLPFAYGIRKVIPVTLIGFASSFLFDILGGMFTNSDQIQKFLKMFPFYYMYDLNLDASFGTIAKAYILSILFIGIMGLITYRIFRKAEIK